MRLLNSLTKPTKITILCSFFCCITGLYTKAQNQDSIIYTYDTIVLKKNPKVIHKTVYIIQEPELPQGWSTEISAGTSFLNRTYSPAIYDFINISSRYEDAHQGMFGYHFEITENYYQKRLLVQAGIGFSECRERFNYTTNFIQSIDTLPGNIIDTTFDNQNYNTTNNFRYIEVPVRVGYTFQKGMTTYFIKAGVVLGYLIDKNGYYISTEEPFLVESLSDHNAINPYTLSSAFSLEIIHNISDQLSVIAEPFLLYTFTSLYDKNSRVVTRNNNLGVKLGVVFHLVD